MTLNTLAWPSSESLMTRWRRHTELSPDREIVVHLKLGESAVRWTWGSLLHAADGYSAALAARGVKPGDTCAIILRHHPELYPLYMGVVGLGAIPAILAYPNDRLHPDKFRSGLKGMAGNSGLDWVLTEPALLDALAPLHDGGKASIGVLTLPMITEAVDERLPVPGASVSVPDCAALLQHSSGTTGLQKAVVLSHRAVLEHVRRYGQALRLSENDRIVSWLPLYHDMGLIAALHMPLALGIPTVVLDPFEWVVAPVILLEAMSEERATLCWMPNFAFSHMAKRLHDDDLTGLSLGHVRAFINCSEPVRQDSFDAFLGRLGALGISPTQLAASYAMAETTFAVTQTAIGAAPRVVHASRQELRAGSVVSAGASAEARACVSSGNPISGCELRILDDRGDACGDRCVGELAVRSESLFDGYRNRPELTEAALRHGWYLTGDLGFTDGGEAFVVGRKKDLIIVAGKNLYPEDIEAVVSTVDGVLPGRVVAFGIDDGDTGTERVYVILETALPDDQHGRLAAAVQAAARAIDVSIARVRVVPPRWLIKSSSGKPSRSQNRDRALALELQEGDA